MNYEWSNCHVRKGKGCYEVSFYGRWYVRPACRSYDAVPDATFKTLKEAKEYAAIHAKYVNVIECPPFGF